MRACLAASPRRKESGCARAGLPHRRTCQGATPGFGKRRWNHVQCGHVSLLPVAEGSGAAFCPAFPPLALADEEPAPPLFDVADYGGVYVVGASGAMGGSHSGGGIERENSVRIMQEREPEPAYVVRPQQRALREAVGGGRALLVRLEAQLADLGGGGGMGGLGSASFRGARSAVVPPPEEGRTSRKASLGALPPGGSSLRLPVAPLPFVTPVSELDEGEGLRSTGPNGIP